VSRRHQSAFIFPLNISREELATILAALRYWKREGLMSCGHEPDIASQDGTLTPLSPDEIDTLCNELESVKAN
jgi:hypothetical protein